VLLPERICSERWIDEFVAEFPRIPLQVDSGIPANPATSKH
jgi:hypothetical protein